MNDIVERETTAVAQTSQSGTLLQAITAAATNPQLNIENVERLFALHQQMVAREAEAAFNDAMARAQAKMRPVANNAYNSQTQSRYAKLAAIADAIVPLYTAEGLSVSFDTEDSGKPEWYRTVAHVSHSGGHTRHYHLDLPLDEAGAKGNVNKTKVHAAGSTSSYARRYLLLMIFNLSTHDDDDANSAPSRQNEIEADPEGKAKLEACGSMRTLTETWNSLPVEKRKTLSAVMNACRARIKAADAETA
jgi:hypothetical protein